MLETCLGVISSLTWNVGVMNKDLRVFSNLQKIKNHKDLSGKYFFTILNNFKEDIST